MRHHNTEFDEILERYSSWGVKVREKYKPREWYDPSEGDEEGEGCWLDPCRRIGFWIQCPDCGMEYADQVSMSLPINNPMSKAVEKMYLSRIGVLIGEHVCETPEPVE